MIKCVPHVQHDYFSSLNQSDHCFLVSSLPSTLHKFPIVSLANFFEYFQLVLDKIRQLPTQYKIVMLGDFNAHYNVANPSGNSDVSEK